MPYEVKPDGSILAATAEEAIALSRKLREEGQATVADDARVEQRRPPRSVRAYEPPSPEETEAKVKALVGVLAVAGKAGVSSQELATKLGLDDPKGLSAYIQALRRVIKDKAPGRREESFFSRKRSHTGTTWRANPERLREVGLLEE